MSCTRTAQGGNDAGTVTLTGTVQGPRCPKASAAAKYCNRSVIQYLCTKYLCSKILKVR